MLPTPVTKDELLMNARTYVVDYVKIIARGCVQKGFPLNSASASMMARIALQCYCEGALAITHQLEVEGRSISAMGGISPEKVIELHEQDKAKASNC